MTPEQTVKIPVEAELRRKGWIADPKMKLHNGEEWYVSPMPLGKRGKLIKDHIFRYFDAAENGNQKDLYDAMEDMGVVAHQILLINYPEISFEQIDYLLTMSELQDFILYVMHGANASKIISDIADDLEKNVESPEKTGQTKQNESGKVSKKSKTG